VALLERLRGRRIHGVGRRAKYLLVDVGEGLTWLVHLGMSGRVLVCAAGAPVAEHEHVRVELEGGRAIAYHDPRRFGLMHVGRAADFAELAGLGPEPLDGAFDGRRLREQLGGTRRAVKAALLDQRVVAGIGNIYANEILFQAGVRPTRRCHRLRREEIDRIARATREVLATAVERRGTTFSDYFDSDGTPGTFQDVLAVFDREGEPCPRCATPIRRRPHGGRSNFYCPRCQR
jgi:formamidopyrimidine-DNA glycosylase